MKRLLIFVFFLTLTVTGMATEEKPTIGFAEGIHYPLKGEPIKVLISHASYPDLTKFQVSVTYRPNSEVMHTETIGSPDSMGTLMWTPQDAGICVIKASAPDPLSVNKTVDIEKSISVRFGKFPISGIIIMLIAAITLFGGLMRSFMRLYS